MGLWVVWQQVRQPSLGPPPTTAQNRFRSARGWHGSSSRRATTRRPGVDVVGKQLDREVAFEFSFGLTRSALRFRSFLKLASRQVGPARHGVAPKTCFQGMLCNKPNIFRWGVSLVFLSQVWCGDEEEEQSHPSAKKGFDTRLAGAHVSTSLRTNCDVTTRQAGIQRFVL